MCVGQKIKSYIEDSGLSQAHVSRKTGIRATKLNLSLNGKRNLSFEEYELICGVLGVGVNKFLVPKSPDKKIG